MNRPFRLPNVLFYIQTVMPILGFFYPTFVHKNVILTEKNVEPTEWQLWCQVLLRFYDPREEKT